MQEQKDIRRISYLISIWLEKPEQARPRWRGALQTLAGQQFPFNTLNELNRLLYELGGWTDPPEEHQNP